MQDNAPGHAAKETIEYFEELGMTAARLREVVRDAWDAVSEDFLNVLIDSMPMRCQAVIDARGATKSQVS
ncbi:unnamed protein product [Penicillium camemberti]|uniref:Str. FM013 n=1 Tax=Penicillium camemberti (strain FM 013) TaxID=1429867 RepID=A0A0G4PHU2_PENC3|nr:unnamed protein product [Penicillium camemberti]